MAGKILSLISGAEQSEERQAKEMPASKWGVFKAAMGGKGKFGKIMTLSLMASMGAALGIYFYLRMASSITYLGTTVPFSSNHGIGYPFSIGTYKFVDLEILDLKFTFFTLLIPSFLLFGLMLSGVFYVAKKWAFMESDFSITKAFLVGIKKNAINFLIIFLLFGSVLFLFNYALGSIKFLQITNGNSAGLVISIILLFVVLGFYSIMTLFMCTLSVTYKMNILHLIKNSFLLTVGLIIRNVIITAVCFLPLVLLVIPGFEVIALMFFAFFGIMLGIVGFTVYSQGVFEKVMGSPATVSYAGNTDAAGQEKSAVIESETKAEVVEKAGEKRFSPTSNAQNQNRNKNKKHSNSKKKKR